MHSALVWFANASH